MPPDRRLIREIRYANRAMKYYAREAGQTIYWFRFHPQTTTMDPVYDVGPQRNWWPPVLVPLIIGEYHRAAENLDDDALYRVDFIHLVISYDQFFRSAIPDPDPDGADHVRDRLGYDNALFEVRSFTPNGRVGDRFLTISVDAVEVGQADLNEDVANPMFAPFITSIPG